MEKRGERERERGEGTEGPAVKEYRKHAQERRGRDTKGTSSKRIERSHTEKRDEASQIY